MPYIKASDICALNEKFRSVSQAKSGCLITKNFYEKKKSFQIMTARKHHTCGSTHSPEFMSWWHNHYRNHHLNGMCIQSLITQGGMRFKFHEVCLREYTTYMIQSIFANTIYSTMTRKENSTDEERKFWKDLEVMLLDCSANIRGVWWWQILEAKFCLKWEFCLKWTCARVLVLMLLFCLLLFGFLVFGFTYFLK